MIKNTCPNAGTPSAGLAGDAEMAAELAGAAAAALRQTARASTGRNPTPVLIRTEISAFRGEARPAVTAWPTRGIISHFTSEWD